MKQIVLTFLFLLLLSASYGQKTPSGSWTLKECIDHALANNINVQRSSYNVENFEVDLKQARFARLPSVNGGASYGFSWGRGLDPVSNSFVSREIASSGLSANASVPLFNGLRIYNTIKQAEDAYEAARYDLQKAKNDVALIVADLFLTVVFNKELLEAAKFQLGSSQQQLDRTRKQVAAGSLPKSEELNLDAQVATNEVTVVQQENALTLSLLNLKQALLIPASSEFDVEIPALTAGDLNLDEDRGSIYEIAREAMPEIKSAALKISSAKYAVKASRGNLFPRLSLVGGLNTNYSSAQEAQFFPDETVRLSEEPVGFVNEDTNYPVYAVQRGGVFRDTYKFDDQIKDNIYRTLSFQLSIPIFNNFNARANIQRAAIQNEQARINAVEADQTLRQNVETAYNNALAASKTYNATMRQLQAREEAFRMMEQRMTAGAANSFEYQVSQNDLFRARTDLTRAKYDFIFRKKVLDFYQGKPIDY